MKSGYLYVLEHPSDPDLYKIGITTRKPEVRLAQHNSNYEEYTGQIVKETGQKWQLKEYIAVPDPACAEAVFWSTNGLSDLPLGGIEVIRLEWKWVQMGLDAAKKAGVRLPPKPRLTPVKDREWMIKQLEGTGITLVGRYSGLVRGAEFQCAKGHVFKKSPGVVAYGKSCPLCGIERKENDIWNWNRNLKYHYASSLDQED
jgi:hypothetical protein